MQFTRRKFIRLSSNGIVLPLIGPIKLFAQTKSMALRSRNLTPEQYREEMDKWEKQQPPMPICYDIRKILGGNFIRVLNEAEK